MCRLFQEWWLRRGDSNPGAESGESGAARRRNLPASLTTSSRTLRTTAPGLGVSRPASAPRTDAPDAPPPLQLLPSRRVTLPRPLDAHLCPMLSRRRLVLIAPRRAERAVNPRAAHPTRLEGSSAGLAGSRRCCRFRHVLPFDYAGFSPERLKEASSSHDAPGLNRAPPLMEAGREQDVVQPSIRLTTDNGFRDRYESGYLQGV